MLEGLRYPAKLFTLAVVLMLLAGAPGFAKCCRCSSQDGTCSAEICCSGGGCLAICVGHNNCLSECVNSQAVHGSGQSGLDELVSVEGSLDQVLDTLGREMGSDVRFTDSDVATGSTMLSVKDVPMWQLLDALARLGPMTVGGEPYSPCKKEAKTFLDERVSMQLEDADGKAVAQALGYVLRGPVEFTPQDPEMVLSLELKDVPLREVLKNLSRFGTISIEGKPYKPE